MNDLNTSFILNRENYESYILDTRCFVQCVSDGGGIIRNDKHNDTRKTTWSWTQLILKILFKVGTYLIRTAVLFINTYTSH